MGSGRVKARGRRRRAETQQSPRRPPPGRAAHAQRLPRSPPVPRERAAGGEEAHRCRGLQARWAAPCGSSRTSRRPSCGPVAARRVRSRVPRSGARAARERAGAALHLPQHRAAATAGLGLRAEPLSSDPAAAAGPRPARAGHCGASSGSAAGLIQPIGCLPVGPAPVREAGPAPGRQATPRSHQGPAPRIPAPVRLLPQARRRPAQTRARPAARPRPALPGTRVGFGRLCPRAARTLLDPRTAVPPPSPEMDIVAPSWGVGHPGVTARDRTPSSSPEVWSAG